MRVASATAAAVAAAVLAGGGTASAAPQWNGGATPHPAAASAGTISTVAGGVGGPGKATTVALRDPCGVAFGAGHVYVADTWAVRAVSPGTGRLTTPAGTGVLGGPTGNGRRATRANMADICDVAVDHSGNLVIADPFDNRIRVVAASSGTFYGQAMTAGHIYAVVGSHRGFSGDGGPATEAGLRGPGSVAVDAAGNLVFGDGGNFRIRVVASRAGTFYGQAMTAGDIYTIAGSGPRAPGTGACGFSGDGGPATSAKICGGVIALDAAGNVVFSDSDRIRVVAARTGTFYGKAMTANDIYTIAGGGNGGDGGPATKAELHQPTGVAIDPAGNVLIADTGNQRVRVVAAHTGTFYRKAMTAGHIYTVAGNGTKGFSGNGGPATKAELSSPSGVALDHSGNLVIADRLNHRIRVVAAHTGTFYGMAMAAGDIYTIAGTGVDANCGQGTGVFSGDGGPATHAQLDSPEGLTVDGAGNMLIADGCSNLIRVAAARAGTFYGKAMTAGDIYTVAGNGTNGFSGDGGPATSAKLDGPGAVTFDRAGNLLIADTSNQRIRAVAGSTGTFYGKAMTAGDIYTVAGNGTNGFSGDGGPATHAEFSFPGDVTADSAGNLVIADSGNNRIRVVASSNSTFYGQAMTAGRIYTVAGNGSPGYSGDGGPATSAGLGAAGVTVDNAGNLVIADTNNNRVRVVAAHTSTFYGQAMTAGDIYTIAGNGTSGFSGDGGPATSAELFDPVAVTVDGAGNVALSDLGNNRVRVVAAHTSTFYGKAMTAGDIYTVAGNGSFGFSGDGGQATMAELNQPIGVAATAAGNLLIADLNNARIRMVSG
jgi:hypothetical protein